MRWNLNFVIFPVFGYIAVPYLFTNQGMYLMYFKKNNCYYIFVLCTVEDNDTIQLSFL